MQSPKLDEHIMRLREMLLASIPNDFTGQYVVHCQGGTPEALDFAQKITYYQARQKPKLANVK